MKVEISNYEDLRELILSKKLSNKQLEKIVWSSMRVFIQASTTTKLIKALDELNNIPFENRGLFYTYE